MIENWFNALFDTVDSLNILPKRYPVDPIESQRSTFEVRKLVFRRYILHYRVDEDRGVVEILSFIHGARRTEV